MKLATGFFAIVIEDFGAGLYWYEQPVSERAAGLVSGIVPGFDYRKHALHIVRIGHVMPATFSGYVHDTVRGGDGRLRKRIESKFVLHVAATLVEALEMRRRLLGIGERADKQVEEETKAYLAKVNRRVRARALANLKALLPQILGEAALTTGALGKLRRADQHGGDAA